MKIDLYTIYPLLVRFPYIKLDRFIAYKNTDQEQVAYKVTLSTQSLYGISPKEKEEIPQILYSNYDSLNKSFINCTFSNFDSNTIDLQTNQKLKQFIETFARQYTFVIPETVVNKSDSFNLLEYIIKYIKPLIEEDILC